MCDAANSPMPPVRVVPMEFNPVVPMDPSSPTTVAPPVAPPGHSGSLLAAPAVAAAAVVDRAGGGQTPNAVAAPASSDPPWLLTFILTPFYDACPVHSPRHRSERNRYDVATGAKLCQYCVAARNKDVAKAEASSGKSSLIQLCRVRLAIMVTVVCGSSSCLSSLTKWVFLLDAPAWAGRWPL